MRFETIKSVYQAALKNDKIIFMTGDLGHAHLDDFKKNIPKQYYNMGIAEQNMIGVAAGLAMSGNRVFVYSIAPFITMRCYEQLKVDVCCHNVGVVAIGISAGYAYSKEGCTHHAIEDIAVMRALPNMHIYSPSTPREARLLTEYLTTTNHPAYLRIGKGGEPESEKEYQITIGRGLVMKKGKDITIFSTGSIVGEALNAANLLSNFGIRAEVINIHTIKPIDTGIVADRVKHRKGIFVLEEHNILGGLGSAIAEIVCEVDLPEKPIFKRFGVPDKYTHLAGSLSFMRKQWGLLGEQVAEKIIPLIIRRV